MKQLNCTLRTPFSAVIIFSGYLVWIKVKTINIKKFLFVIHFSQRPLKIQFVCGLQLVLEVNLVGCLNRLHVLDQLNKVHFIRGGGDFSLQKLSLSTFLLNLRLDFFFFVSQNCKSYSHSMNDYFCYFLSFPGCYFID